jgi:hypothetical protein
VTEVRVHTRQRDASLAVVRSCFERAFQVPLSFPEGAECFVREPQPALGMCARLQVQRRLIFDDGLLVLAHGKQTVRVLQILRCIAMARPEEPGEKQTRGKDSQARQTGRGRDPAHEFRIRGVRPERQPSGDWPRSHRTKALHSRA